MHKIVEQTELLNLGMTIGLGSRKIMNSNLLNPVYKLTLCHILPFQWGWVKTLSVGENIDGFLWLCKSISSWMPSAKRRDRKCWGTRSALRHLILVNYSVGQLKELMVYEKHRRVFHHWCYNYYRPKWWTFGDFFSFFAFPYNGFYYLFHGGSFDALFSHFY